MIKVRNVSKKYEEPVLQNIDLDIEDESIFGLIGISGAGKSTLLNMLSGVMDVDSGEILYDDEKIYENVKLKRDIFFLPDEPFYTVNATPKNIINAYKMFYNIDLKKYNEILDLFKLPKNRSMYNFSKGMKRQVFVALALAIKPKYLFLDETFDGLDPFARLALKREIINLVDNYHTTVIISSHSLRELSDICDSFGLIDNNKIASFGQIDEFMKKYHKYIMAFNEEYDLKDFDGIPLVKFSKEGKIISCVTSLDYEAMTERIKDFNPIVIDEIKLDFEEEFMIEVESRGEESC